jgi:hypothetical protein
MTVAVVFFADASEWWLRLLKPGFRHCSVLIANDFGGWISLESCSNQLYLGFDDRPHAPGAIVGNGPATASIELTINSRPLPRRPRLRPLTCVEVVKHALGIYAPGVITPWRLYRHLRKDH